MLIHLSQQELHRKCEHPLERQQLRQYLNGDWKEREWPHLAREEKQRDIVSLDHSAHLRRPESSKPQRPFHQEPDGDGQQQRGEEKQQRKPCDMGCWVKHER